MIIDMVVYYTYISIYIYIYSFLFLGWGGGLGFRVSSIFFGNVMSSGVQAVWGPGGTLIFSLGLASLVHPIKPNPMSSNLNLKLKHLQPLNPQIP